MIRFGIVGNGRIAKRFMPEAKKVEGVLVCAVYNPHIESGRRFAADFGLHFFDEWEEFLDVVDAVYIAAPHQFHYEYAEKAMRQGKHVLCEKPMVLSKGEAKELYHLAGENNLVLMEGIKTAYCPGFQKILELVQSGVIGEVKYIDACFTKLEDAHTRELTDVTYGGSFRELGSYVMLPAIKIFGCDYRDASFDSIRNKEGIDIFTQAILRYSGGCTANLLCGLGVKGEGRLMLSGTKGYLLAEAPWWKTTHISVHYEDASQVGEYACEFVGDGLAYEIEEFLRRIQGDGEKVQSVADTQFIGLSDIESIAMAGVMERFGKIGEM